MKKVTTGVILCIVFVIIYFLQLNFFSWFTISGVQPNLFIILILFIGLYSGLKMGVGFGVGFGLLIDVLGASIIRAISNNYGNHWVLTEDILRKIYPKIVK